MTQTKRVSALALQTRAPVREQVGGTSYAGAALRLPMRLGVYTDMGYQSDGDRVYSNRAFVRFVTRLPPRVAELVVFGRLDPRPGGGPYALPGGAVRFIRLPYYPRISSIRSMLGSVRESCRLFDAELSHVDAVWVFGPHPMALLFAWLARRRGKPLMLGVRQDYPRYIARRLPSRRWGWAVPVAHVLDALFRLLARAHPTVAVGEDLARRYSVGGPVLATGFSLVERRDLVSLEAALAKSWDEERRILSVGRLDPEKNPALLLDIATRLHAEDPRWRMLIAGDGPLRRQLADDVERRGLRGVVELLGEVTNGRELWSLYRRCHVFLHVSLTEGVPQVLFESHAAGLPIVATDVGGVRSGLSDGAAGLLIPPCDAKAAVAALNRLADHASLRRRLIRTGLERVRTETLEAQLDRVASFVAENVGA